MMMPHSALYFLPFLVFFFAIEAVRDDEQLMDAFFKSPRTSGACVENFLALMNKHMSAQERAHWEATDGLDIKDLEAFASDFTYDHGTNSVLLETFKMDRGMLDFGDNDKEMRFKFYIFDGFRYNFTPNGQVLPQNMAKIAFMIHWQKLVMDKGNSKKPSWKFIDYHFLKEKSSGLKDVYLCDLLRIAVSRPQKKQKIGATDGSRRDTANSGKGKMVYSPSRSSTKSGLFRGFTKTSSKATSAGKGTKGDYTGEMEQNVRSGFQTMLRQLNKKEEITKLRSVLSRWEHLERYKYWAQLCSRPYAGADDEYWFTRAMEKFAQNFIDSKGHFQTYNQMKIVFAKEDEYMWTIVKSVVYPALEHYVHRQQKFDASDLTEVPLLISLCINQRKDKKGKLSLEKIKSLLASKPQFLAEMMGKYKPAWLDAPVERPKQRDQHYISQRFDVDRFKGNMFMPIDEMEHELVRILLAAQTETDWKWSEIEANGNLRPLGGMDNAKFFHDFLNAQGKMFKFVGKSGKISLEINMEYFGELKKYSLRNYDLSGMFGRNQQQSSRTHDGNLSRSGQADNLHAWLYQCLEAYMILTGKSRAVFDHAERLTFALQISARIFHRLLALKYGHFYQQHMPEYAQLLTALDRLGQTVVKLIVLRQREENQRNAGPVERHCKKAGSQSGTNRSSSSYSYYGARSEQAKEQMAWTNAAIDTILNDSPRMDLYTIGQRDECIERLALFQSLWQFDIHQKYGTNFGQDLLDAIDIGQDQSKHTRPYNCTFKLGQQIKSLFRASDKRVKGKKLKKFLGEIDTKLWLRAEGQLEMLFAAMADRRDANSQQIQMTRRRQMGFAGYQVELANTVQLSAYILMAGIFALNRQLRIAFWADTLDGTQKLQEIQFKWEMDQWEQREEEGQTGATAKWINGFEMRTKMVSKLRLLRSVGQDLVDRHSSYMAYDNYHRMNVYGLRKEPIYGREHFQSVQQLAEWVETMTIGEEALAEVFAEMSWKGEKRRKTKKQKASSSTSLTTTFGHAPHHRRHGTGHRKRSKHHSYSYYYYVYGSSSSSSEEGGGDDGGDGFGGGEDEEGGVVAFFDDLGLELDSLSPFDNIEMPSFLPPDFEWLSSAFGLDLGDFANIDFDLLPDLDFTASVFSEADWADLIGGVAEACAELVGAALSVVPVEAILSGAFEGLLAVLTG